MSRLTDIIRPFILDAALPREVDLDYPVDGKAWEAEQTILAWVENEVIGSDYYFNDDAFPTEVEKIRLEDRNKLLAQQRKRARL